MDGHPVKWTLVLIFGHEPLAYYSATLYLLICQLITFSWILFPHLDVLTQHQHIPR